MKRILKSLKILKKEPELWMSYLYGQKYAKLTHLHKPPKYEGKVFRVIALYYYMLKKTQFFKRKKVQKAEFLSLAGTYNQKAALVSTIDNLNNLGKSVLFMTEKGGSDEKSCCKKSEQKILFSITDIVCGLVINLIRFRKVSRSLRKKDSRLLYYRLDEFLSSHFYLAYFYRILTEANPSYIIVSNDHNTINRALLAVANYKKIKTIYLQHASVSDIFPALNFDYAFLDGLSALETYKSCENNRPKGVVIKSNRQVFLSGQKKIIKKVPHSNRESIGVALNALDDTDDIQRLIGYLVQNGFRPLIRYHPGLGENKVKELKNLIGDRVSYSDPNISSLNDFFEKSTTVIAGNSSILLEAALAGLTPIYYQITDTAFDDYYMFARKGVAIKCDRLIDLVELINNISSGKITIKSDSVRYFSSTYDTKWFGKEGELVARILKSISFNNETEIEPITL